MTIKTKTRIVNWTICLTVGPALAMNGIYTRHLVFWLILVPFAVVFATLMYAWEEQLKTAAQKSAISS